MRENILERDSYLIVLGAGSQQVSAYKTASRLGLKTLAIDYNPKAKARDLADKFLLASIKDKVECISKLKKLNLHYSGVTTIGVEVSPVVSAIAKEFNLSSVSETVAFNTTNKCARATVLQKAGIPAPKFEIINERSLPKIINYPLIIKPSDNSGSRGVRIVESEKEWFEAYDDAKSISGDGKVIVEELLQGDEISIEGFVLDGKMIIVGFSDRNYISSYHPYFMEDGSSSPTNLPHSVIVEAEKVFAKAAYSLGVTEGPSKGDLIVTKEGVKVLEITSRLSPGFSLLLPHTEGTDPLEATIRWAVNMHIPQSLLQPKFHKAMAHRFFFHQPGKVTKITGLENLKKQPGVIEVIFLRDFTIGDILEPPNNINRLFYIYTVADNRDTAIRLAEEALSTVNIQVDK
ncbi:MAG: ATP-grasp domain-containing protein [Patescibacteria group bacterium]|nr:ATP-grasp domain-containing protein [Patescibacteria group bacterium]